MNVIPLPRIENFSGVFLAFWAVTAILAVLGLDWSDLMIKWTADNVSHTRRVGIFTLHVWPLKASKECPYGAWALILGDGNSEVLPSSVRARVRFASLDEAKTWIEAAVRDVCQAAISELMTGE